MRICLFISSFGDGGVERMLVHLARGLAELECEVSLVTREGPAPFLDQLPDSVRVVRIPPGSPRQRRGHLQSLLARERPHILLSAKLVDDQVALDARDRLGYPVRVVLRTGTTFSARLSAGRRRWWSAWRTRRQVRATTRRADALVAVSRGVADDLAQMADIPRERIHVIRNPVITPELLARSREPASHPWLVPGHEVPVLLGMGGLRRQKDFPTLLRAFARLRAQRPARLLILGQGRQQQRLEALARELGVQEDVQLPGFVDNPHAWLANADLFVLSSAWEGSPNALAEALAVGCPVVSTDCPSGPREILAGGRYGPLVSVGDVEALAQAMAGTLAEPPAAEHLREAVDEYHMLPSARAYLAVFAGGEPASATQPADRAGAS